MDGTSFCVAKLDARYDKNMTQKMEPHVNYVTECHVTNLLNFFQKHVVNYLILNQFVTEILLDMCIWVTCLKLKSKLKISS
jgi:hypothetical protein